LQLRRFILDDTRVVTLPETVGNLSNLIELTICHNAFLTSLPETIGNLSNLTELYIEHNCRLPSLPNSAGNLLKLRKISIIPRLKTPLPIGLWRLEHLDSDSLEGYKASILYDNYKKTRRMIKGVFDAIVGMSY
jgi:leucine-rich repeat protein SHOC2